jgi:membrane protease YdiL (CAAX protease family)
MSAQASRTAPIDARPAAVSARPRRFARWRPRSALLAIVIGFVLSQLTVLAFQLVAGGESDHVDGITATSLVLADVVLIGVVLAFARRGAERLTPATLGIRRTRFGPALGWMLVVYFGVIALEGLWALLITQLGAGAGVSRQDAGSPGAPSPVAALAIFFAIAVMAPIGEEVGFRGYLFPALTRWRGPWIGAILTGLLFGGAHFLVYPLPFLPALTFFGFGACVLFWFTGSLLPSISLHAVNNAIATGVLLGWSWQVPLGVLGAVAVALLLLAPFARERAPQTA